MNAEGAAEILMDFKDSKQYLTVLVAKARL